jgi:nitroreductase
VEALDSIYKRRTILDSIYKRRTIRSFRNIPIEEEKLTQLIEAAIHAPSGTNRQGWYFLKIVDQETKDKLVQMGGGRIIRRAPTGLMVFYKVETLNVYYHDDFQSAAAAIQNIFLTAYELGIGGAWVCQLPPPWELRRMFNAPRGYRPIAYLALGYPKNVDPKKLKRPGKIKSVEDHVGVNMLGAVPMTLKTKYSTFIKRILVRCFYFTPKFLRKYLEPFVYKHFVSKF